MLEMKDARRYAGIRRGAIRKDEFTQWVEIEHINGSKLRLEPVLVERIAAQYTVIYWDGLDSFVFKNEEIKIKIHDRRKP